MHIETDSNTKEVVITENDQNEPFDFWKAVVRFDLGKFVYVCSVIIMMFMIVTSLVINPKSLDIQRNAFIGLVGGVIISKFGDLGNYFFPTSKKKKDE
jgi:hypothetical protein